MDETPSGFRMSFGLKIVLHEMATEDYSLVLRFSGSLFKNKMVKLSLKIHILHQAPPLKPSFH